MAPLLAFTVDPQEEAERKESRLAVIADHLGFSWTGKQTLKVSPMTVLQLKFYSLTMDIFTFL